MVFFHSIKKKKQTIPSTTTCYYAGLNRTIVYQSSPPHYYAYVIGSKSDFLPNKKVRRSSLSSVSSVSQSVSSIDFWSLEINCFVARVITYEYEWYI